MKTRPERDTFNLKKGGRWPIGIANGTNGTGGTVPATLE
jgi:hypothetical protein